VPGTPDFFVAEPASRSHNTAAPREKKELTNGLRRLARDCCSWIWSLADPSGGSGGRTRQREGRLRARGRLGACEVARGGGWWCTGDPGAGWA